MKPEELGYCKDNNFNYSKVCFVKKKAIAILEIKPDYYMRRYVGRIVPKIDIENQKDLDYLQKILDIMQQDLKELNDGK